MATTKPTPTPATMKAVRIHEYGDAGKLQLEDAPRPRLAEDQVLVRVRYAGVNPIDWKIRSGQARRMVEVKFPYTLGQDFSGEIAEPAPESEAGNPPTEQGLRFFSRGDRVFGFARGTYAEYVAAPLSDIALIPQTMDFATAAALPIAGSTALQAIRDLIGAHPSMRILIHGAAGGVGSFASQIAIDLGAEVIGTASGEDLSYLKSLCIAQVIDYQHERFEEKAGMVDAVLDLVGGETLARSYAIVKQGGVLVTTAGQINEKEAQQAGIRGIHMVMKPNAGDLEALAALVLRGAVKPRIDRVLPLKAAREAQELSETGRAHGKILLKVD